MKKVRGFFIPKGDKYLEDTLKNVDPKMFYQQWKVDQSLRYIVPEKTRRALDIGSSIGSISVQLAKRFKSVECFEPEEKSIQCFVKNTSKYNNIRLNKVAVGSVDGKKVSLNKSESVVLSHIKEGNNITQRTIDSFNFNDVDFVKIDVEGYELDVLMGMVDTLGRCSPVIMVEHRGYERRFGYDTEYLPNFLNYLGYTRVRELNGDFVYIKNTKFTRPKNYDPDKPTAILGGGPSAAGLDLDRLQRTTNLVSINDSIRHTSESMAFFTLDGTYFKRSYPFKGYKGPKFIALPYDKFKHFGLNRVEGCMRLDRVREPCRFGVDPLTICSGGEKGVSGFGALDLVWKWAAKRVILLGFDGNPVDEGENTHWNRESNHDRWSEGKCNDVKYHFEEVSNQLKDDNVEVINACEDSLIDCFPRINPEDILP